jgi:hypothetical protein
VNEIGSLSVTFQGGFRYRSDSGEVAIGAVPSEKALRLN